MNVPASAALQALIMIGKDLKMAALEYEEGLETLDRVVASPQNTVCHIIRMSRRLSGAAQHLHVHSAPACEGNQVNN